MARHKKKKGGRKKKLSPWVKHVMAEYRKNKKAGFSAAMKRAKKTYRRKKK